jgi:hypothetical protein
MNLYLDEKSYHLDWGFPEKISFLKKRASITLKFSIYTYSEEDIVSNSHHIVRDKKREENKKLEVVKSMTDVPINVYVSKSDYYWWVFDECYFISVSVNQDKNYYDYQGRDTEKWQCELTFSYKDVYGSNKKAVVDRDIKLKKLFNE